MVQDYFWLLCVIGFASIMQGLKIWDTYSDKNITLIFRKVVYGMGGSALAVVTIYHLCLYFNLNNELSICIGGCCGYIGSEFFIKFIERFLENKIDKS